MAVALVSTHTMEEFKLNLRITSYLPVQEKQLHSNFYYENIMLVSLLDQSFDRIKIPAISKSCYHAQAFDLDSFLKFNENQPVWKCIVCKSNVSSKDIFIDGYFEDLLLKYPHESFIEISNDKTNRLPTTPCKRLSDPKSISFQRPLFGILETIIPTTVFDPFFYKYKKFSSTFKLTADQVTAISVCKDDSLSICLFISCIVRDAQPIEPISLISVVDKYVSEFEINGHIVTLQVYFIKQEHISMH